MPQEKKGRAGIWSLAVKFSAKVSGKLLSVVAKIAKGAKITKVALAGASFASYAYMFTWKFALMVIFMLFVHESGHIWAMKRYGVKTKGIYFIPFVGGAAIAESDFPSRKAEVVIAIMGPIWGFLLALATGLVYLETRNPLFAAASAWMAMINLFNLLPINPLDGGRIFKSIAFSIHSKAGLVFLALGLVACGFIVWKIKLGLFLLLLIIGTFDLLYEYRSDGSGKIKKLRKKAMAVEMKILATEKEIRDICGHGPHGESCPCFKRREELSKQLAELRSERLHLQFDTIYALRRRREVMTAKTARPLDALGILGSACAYLVVAAVLFGLMHSMNHVEGAKMAMKVLQG